MSLLNYLQLQEIDDFPDDEMADFRRPEDDDISLDDQLDETSLENYWEQVVDDIHEDPEWSTFADE
ncbi:hypothetical protein CVV43_01075 [Candidatus Saccharibacteria bacterium HGW-Saccharibacteria-1]|jgi:hypothetical protein|nr:MAG: hypothetical protein CVV43_01075 [Candidatus Saccharibacteria bacterium HGW-Saccharibacteria-1]